MNTKMILPATIAAGLHAMVFSYRGTPAAPVAPTPPPVLEVVDFVPIPPVEEEFAPVERYDTEDIAPPSQSVPQRPDVISLTVDPGVITIPHVPVPPYVRSDAAFIPTAIGGPGGTPEMPVTIDGLDRIPRALMRHAPSTPPGYLGTATVTVDFVVGKDGRVQHVQIVDSTDPHLDDACLRTVRRWRFEPGTRNSLPVAFRMQQTFVFTARD